MTNYTGKFPSQDKENNYLQELAAATLVQDIPVSEKGKLDPSADLWVEKAMNHLEAQFITGVSPSAVDILNNGRNAVSVALARAEIAASPSNDNKEATNVMNLIKDQAGVTSSQLEGEIEKIQGDFALARIARENGQNHPSSLRAALELHSKRAQRWMKTFVLGSLFGSLTTLGFPHAKDWLTTPDTTVGYIKFQEKNENNNGTTTTIYVRRFDPADKEPSRQCDTNPTSGAETRLGEMKTVCIVPNTNTPPCHAFHKDLAKEVADASKLKNDKTSVGIPCVQK